MSYAVQIDARLWFATEADCAAAQAFLTESTEGCVGSTIENGRTLVIDQDSSLPNLVDPPFEELASRAIGGVIDHASDWGDGWNRFREPASAPLPWDLPPTAAQLLRGPLGDHFQATEDARYRVTVELLPALMKAWPDLDTDQRVAFLHLVQDHPHESTREAMIWAVHHLQPRDDDDGPGDAIATAVSHLAGEWVMDGEERLVVLKDQVLERFPQS